MEVGINPDIDACIVRSTSLHTEASIFCSRTRNNTQPVNNVAN